jgi:hypothetical protein
MDKAGENTMWIPISGASKIKIHPFANIKLPTTDLPVFDAPSYQHHLLVICWPSILSFLSFTASSFPLPQCSACTYFCQIFKIDLTEPHSFSCVLGLAMSNASSTWNHPNFLDSRSMQATCTNQLQPWGESRHPSLDKWVGPITITMFSLHPGHWFKVISQLQVVWSCWLLGTTLLQLATYTSVMWRKRYIRFRY